MSIAYQSARPVDRHRSTLMEQLYHVDETMHVASGTLEAILFDEWIPQLQETDYYNFLTQRLEPMQMKLYSFRTGAFEGINRYASKGIATGSGREHLLVVMSVGKALVMCANIKDGTIMIGQTLATFLYHRPEFKSALISGVPTAVELADPKCFDQFKHILTNFISHNPYSPAELKNG